MIPAVLLLQPPPSVRPRLHGGGEKSPSHPTTGERTILLARVIARLAEGDFTVAVGGQTLRMSLPPQTQAGDVLKLVLVSRQPQLTFALAEPAPQTQAPILSSVGRLAAALASPEKGPVPALNRGEPVTEQPSNAEQLSHALHATIELSGLFYESHQAQWIAGERSFAQLFLEPQARLAPAVHNPSGAAPESHVPPNSPTAAGATQDVQLPQALAAGDPAAAAPPPHPLSELLLASASTSAYASSPVSAAPVQVIATHTLPLVQQQLVALEVGQIVWQGQLWPGQWLDWRIEEHPPPARSIDEPAEWRTSLRLELPRLGTVSARLDIAPGGAINVSLEASSEASTETMRSNAETLERAITAAGIALRGLRVTHHGTA